MSINDVASVGSGATDVRRSHTGARARVKRLNDSICQTNEFVRWYSMPRCATAQIGFDLMRRAYCRALHTRNIAVSRPIVSPIAIVDKATSNFSLLSII